MPTPSWRIVNSNPHLMRMKKYAFVPCTFGTLILIFCLFQRMSRAGLGLDWSRIKNITTKSGDYRMILEPGSIPDNHFLPPHLRLDKRSYLDNDWTAIAEAPVVDFKVTHADAINAAPGLLPEHEKNEMTLTIGGVGSRMWFLPAVQMNRFLDRRLGLSSDEKELLDGGGKGPERDGYGVF